MELKFDIKNVSKFEVLVTIKTFFNKKKFELQALS